MEINLDASIKRTTERFRALKADRRTAKLIDIFDARSNPVSTGIGISTGHKNARGLENKAISNNTRFCSTGANNTTCSAKTFKAVAPIRKKVTKLQRLMNGLKRKAAKSGC